MRVALRMARWAVLLSAAAALFPAPASAAAQVYAFPIPGGRVASPSTQITLRGVSPSRIAGAILVGGSKTGLHPGTVVADSDGNGGSFFPAQPFAPGETVTVRTSLNVHGARNGLFQFTIGLPAGGLPSLHWPPAKRIPGDIWQFRSRPDLKPAAVVMTKRSRGASPGDIFLAPQFGPLQDGPEILDPSGALVWFNPLSGNDSASDLKVQTYHGAPVLTWWQGYVSAGIGVGQDLIYNSNYQQVAAVHAGNGVSADLHDFQITPRGTALITSSFPVYWNASAVHGSKRQIVLDSIVQEIDIPTGLVLFQWDSLDHVPVTDTYQALPNSKYPFDYFHVNSVQLDTDGGLLVSGRNTWAAYKLDHRSGGVIWRLGGRHSSFRLAPGTYWAFQHDVRARAGHDLFVTLFDNSAGPPTIHQQSRGIKLFVDLKHMTARQVADHVHAPALSTQNEGNFQQLPDRDDFLGWGQQGDFDEYSPNGQLLLEGHFVDGNSNYRAYRFGWSGTPVTPPSVAVSRSGKIVTVSASWNGATHVRSWRILGGPSPTALHGLRTVPKSGFETTAHVGPQAYVAVQPLDWSGHVMATSVVRKVG